MLEQTPLHAAKIRFGVFEADLRAGELRKCGIRIKLQSQPFKLLTVLLSRPGEIVSREELQQQLWGSERSSTSTTAWARQSIRSERH